MTQISGPQFVAKCAALLVHLIMFASYCLFRWRRNGRDFLFSGQRDERLLMARGEVDVARLQAGPWTLNANKTTSYAAFSVGTLILTAVFIFDQRLNSYDAYAFSFLMAVFASSVLAYFASLQFWFMAVDVAGSDQSKLRYRTLATNFQSFGWLSMHVATISAVLVVSTPVGAALGAASVFTLVLVYEVKGRCSEQEFASWHSRESSESAARTHSRPSNGPAAVAVEELAADTGSADWDGPPEL